MKYSVIVPIYNSRTTLQRCINSVIMQNFSDYELILINDGSNDGSGSICKLNAQRHPQIKYIEARNSGVSVARNLGLDSAEGEYVLFLDSDDFVADDYFLHIDNILCQENVDMLLFASKTIENGPRSWSTGTFFENSENNIAEKIAYAMYNYSFSSLCNKVFRREIIEKFHLRFDNDLDIGEDQTFIFTYAMHIHSIASIDNILYCVDVTDESSLSRKSRPYLTEQLFKVNRRMYQAYRETTHSPAAAASYESALSWVTYRSAYSCFKELLKFDCSLSQRRKKIHQICKLYREENVKPKGLKCRLIALPVQLGWSTAIDLLIRYKSR